MKIFFSEKCEPNNNNSYVIDSVERTFEMK